MPKVEHPHISELRLKSLPALPGVYLMKDKNQDVIYIGKAKHLRNRVRSYFNFSDSRLSVKFIVRKVVTLETLITEDERQALILECDLINRYRPRYNIQLKDDKSHLLVRINMDHLWPRLQLVRERRDDGAKYLGPFAFSYELKALLEIINRTLPLRSCTDSVLGNRVRPCLEYQIKRCAAPCCLPVAKSDYDSWLGQAIRILEGKGSEVLESLEQEMARASSELRFEDAASIRDRIGILKRSWIERPNSGYAADSQDAIGFYREEGRAEFSVLRVRAGRLVEPLSWGIEEAVFSDDELISSFISRYYEQNQDIPSEILLSSKLEDLSFREEVYSEKRGSKVNFHIPQKGAKARLLKLALTNAEENFIARGSGQPAFAKGLKMLQEKLGLEDMPRTMECIDISHFQGDQTVGSVVFFRDGRPAKDRYRRFNLEEQTTPDDFASMKEVVRRHLSRLVEENLLPDLIVIDGGKGQLSSAIEARQEVSGSAPAMIGLAKKRTIQTPYKFVEAPGKNPFPVKPERIFLEEEKEPVILEPESEALHILERIRNEAHRFAITLHRKKRGKQQFRSALDLVKGVGPKRRRDLLREFGSVDAIRQAKAEEIVKRTGLPMLLAESIVAGLNKTSSSKD